MRLAADYVRLTNLVCVTLHAVKLQHGSGRSSYDDLAKLNRLRQIFADLLQDLSATWPEQDIEYVREEVGHSVFGDALENLIAIGLRNGMGFNPDQVQQVQALAAIMAMEDSPFIGQLRRTMRGSS